MRHRLLLHTLCKHRQIGVKIPLTIGRCETTCGIVSKDCQHPFVVNKILRNKHCPAFFHRRGYVFEDTRPGLSKNIPSIDRFKGQGVDWRLVLVEIEPPGRDFAKQLTSSMANDFVDRRSHKAYDMCTLLEKRSVCLRNVVAGIIRITVCTHTIAKNDIFEAVGLSDVVVL